MKNISLLIILSFVLAIACSPKKSNEQAANSHQGAVEFPFHTLNTPEGFEISLYASGIDNARSLAMGTNGTIFVGNRTEDKVYAVVDSDGDYIADTVYVLASGLRMPNGVAFKDGDLYVAEVSRILRFKDIENNLASPTYEVVYDQYPTDRHHGWKYIAFGPDGLLYVPVGAPCNICESAEIYASITRLDVAAADPKPEIYAHGVRNTVGFAWHPETDELWFTDNGRDHLGDNFPPCELNHAPTQGMHFGYPYCHGGDIQDPEFGNKRDCKEFVAPAQKLGPHVAPLGMLFYTGDMWPEIYKNHIFIAEHGSWNRSSKIGYRITLVKLDGNKAISYEPFIDGWLDEEEQEAWGRPVALLQLPDGSVLISDDKAGAIYRISYKG
jgi:glucose/arabinose dehydrogenase